MSDIKQLLSQTARSAEATPSSDVVEADVHRGRAALVRRRRRRAVGSSVGGTVAAAALVATTIVVGSPGGSDETVAPTPDSRVDSGPDRGTPVRLVAYTGDQPNGFVVDWVPQGWYIQPPAHAEYTVTIAENGDTSHPDGFEGKLVVMLMSRSFPQELPPWGDDPVEVNGQPGVIDHGGGADSLFFRYPDGRFVEVQAWSNLGWDNEQLVRFAEGITVTADAKAGVG